jgi:hypothetical protein
VRAVVLVEGESDRAAVEALAARRGRHLAAEGVEVVAMGGFTNVRAHLARYGPGGLDVALAGLVDANEEPYVRRVLAESGLGHLDTFHACHLDLEDELLRALGVDAVEAVVAAAGELPRFRAMQRQVAQRERSTHDQLRRFMGTKGGRKIRYAPLLVAALDLDAVPDPLDRVLAAVEPDPDPNRV